MTAKDILEKEGYEVFTDSQRFRATKWFNPNAKIALVETYEPKDKSVLHPTEIDVKIKLLHENAALPTKGTKDSVGWDAKAVSKEEVH